MRRFTPIAFSMLIPATLATLALLRVPAAAQFLATEPEQAGPDFAAQGEYAGKAKTGTDTTGSAAAADFAAQVVALGHGNFNVVFYAGGLPGDGWDGVHRYEAVGARAPDGVEFSGDEYHGVLKGDTLSGASEGGDPFVLVKRVRASPTLGLPPPAGAVILYGADHSVAAWDSAGVDERGFFMPLAPESETRARFADFSLHLEFRLSFQPDAGGRARANSGLQFMVGPLWLAELQILDSFGEKPYTDNGGGLETLFPAAVQANLPPLAWQTYDVRLTTPKGAADTAWGTARVTVWQNGILIHDGQDIPFQGSAANLALQRYNDPVFFRNIWVLEGNDHYPFFPGAAVRAPGSSAARGKASGVLRSGRMSWPLPGTGPSAGPRSGVLANGVRVPWRPAGE